MKKKQIAFSKSFSIGTIVMMSVLLGMTSCITAATIVTISYIKSRMEHTAVVLLDASPAEVYRAMEQVAAAKDGLIIKSQDPEKHTMKVQKDKNTVTAQAKRLENGKTQLKVTATADADEFSHEDLALLVVGRVCDTLGVRYEVVEKKRLFK